jgi:hypothetical protein
MAPAKARDVARAYHSCSLQLTEMGLVHESAGAARNSQWWLTYAIRQGGPTG